MGLFWGRKRGKPAPVSQDLIEMRALQKEIKNIQYETQLEKERVKLEKAKYELERLRDEYAPETEPTSELGEMLKIAMKMMNTRNPNNALLPAGAASINSPSSFSQIPEPSAAPAQNIPDLKTLMTQANKIPSPALKALISQVLTQQGISKEEAKLTLEKIVSVI